MSPTLAERIRICDILDTRLKGVFITAGMRRALLKIRDDIFTGADPAAEGTPEETATDLNAPSDDDLPTPKKSTRTL